MNRHRMIPNCPFRTARGIASRIVAGVAFGALALLPGGCTGGRATAPYSVAVGGSPQQGRRVIAEYKCGTCHTIPGIEHAHGVFGPPLNFMGHRTMIAGNIANTPENLAHWIMSPKSMKPATAMPDLGLTQRQARNAAAYLETLQ